MRTIPHITKQMWQDLPKVWADTETKSEIPIERGAHNYLTGKVADILLWGHAYNTSPVIDLWQPGHDVPDFFTHPDDYIHIYFNAPFDYMVSRVFANRYGIKPPKMSHIVDMQAVCARYTLPQNLDQAAPVLNCEYTKNKDGKALIKKICCPPFEYTKEDWDKFCVYCQDDVRTMRAIAGKVPNPFLSVREHKTWAITFEINERGVPVDLSEVSRINEVTSVYKEEHSERLPALTGGRITKVTQTARIKTFIQERGIDIPNVTAETVEGMLKRDDLPEDVYELLFLRSELNKSSTAKYDMIEKCCYQGRVRWSIIYYGGHTGRWAGRNFQIQNLPRAFVDYPEEVIAAFKSLEVLDPDFSCKVKGKDKELNPVQLASSLVRSMIKAPEGKLINANDYTSIENYLLLWLAGHEDIVRRQYEGLDGYKDMASHLYGVPYETINDDQRFFGKVIILGCGYGLGGVGFVGVADSWGISLSIDESRRAVNAFRSKYHLVPKLWYTSQTCVITALRNPGKKFAYRDIQYRVTKCKAGNTWLVVTLPNGTNLFYFDPKLTDGKFGETWKYRGRHPKTKQFTWLHMTPGKLIENIVQALAREVVVDAKIKMAEEEYEIIGSMHDEIVTLIDEEGSQETMAHIQELMIPTEGYLGEIPLRCTGFAEKRFRKD